MKYIIFINSIVDIGGGQQYCRNKAVGLTKMGYDVFVFSATKGTILIQELKKYEELICVPLRYKPDCFNKKVVERTINFIDALSGGIDSETIIDCAGINNSIWGEMIAKRFNCKSVCFLIDESFELSESVARFLMFKHSRFELAGTSKASLKLLFKGFYDLSQEECYSFQAICDNTAEDVPSLLPELLDDKRFTLGCFGRIDKGYVIPSLIGLRDYVLENSGSLFNVVVIGGSSNKKAIKNIQKLFRPVKNAKLLITGYTFPVPSSLLKSLDVCLASSGCAKVLAEQGTPTIYVNCLNGEPIGIYNYTVSPEDDNRYKTKEGELHDYINAILFGGYCESHRPIISVKSKDHSKRILDELSLEKSFINRNTSKVFYDIGLLKSRGRKEVLFKTVGRLFGPAVLYFVHLKLYSAVFKG